MKVESFTTHCDEYKIRGNIHFPDNHHAPCVICSHGLFSSKESPKFIAIAEYLAQEGFVAIRYDHRGCGESEGRIEETTVSSRLKDLESILGLAHHHPRITEKMGLFGSSMGGYISLIKGAQQPELKATVVWATPYKLRATKNDIKEDGYPLLKESFYEDLNRYHLGDMLGGIKQCFVLHGQNDELVPVWHAKKIFECLDEPKKIEIFPGGDHRFTDDNHRKKAMRLSVEFFEKYLK
jgi:alpha-beta hydrolase superfamily lysophospholipase